MLSEGSEQIPFPVTASGTVANDELEPVVLLSKEGRQVIEELGSKTFELYHM